MSDLETELADAAFNAMLAPPKQYPIRIGSLVCFPYTRTHVYRVVSRRGMMIRVRIQTSNRPVKLGDETEVPIGQVEHVKQMLDEGVAEDRFLAMLKPHFKDTLKKYVDDGVLTPI